MKRQIVIDGESAVLDLQQVAGEAVFTLTGSVAATGHASIAETAPGVFSVLLGQKSVTVHVIPHKDGLEAWTGGKRYAISLADLRDRAAKVSSETSAGPMEIRAHMPGKVVKLLVEPGTKVEAGQGLAVVEAMKMQNEMKSPKSGVVKKIYTTEGATVAAGERLLVVE